MKKNANNRAKKTASSKRAPLQRDVSSQGCKLCAVFGRCGGCSALDVPYSDQLANKQRFVADLFADMAEPEALRPILGMDDPFHYRNKVASPYAPGRMLSGASAGGVASTRKATSGGKRVGREGTPGKGKAAASAVAREPQRREILTGMYAKGTHELIPTDECALENVVAKKVTLVVRDLMRKWNIAPYDEDTGEGFLRHAVVRVGHSSGEVLVTLVTNDDAFPSSKSFCRELVRRVPAITTVVQNVNTRQTNVILGSKERTLYGPGFILDTLCGLSFRISSRSFYQVNATQTEVLYNTAIDLAVLRGEETLIDAYCGTGTIGLVAASCGAARVIGVDNVESAIRDAQNNARHNRIENAEFVTADASEFLDGLAAQMRLGTAQMRLGTALQSDGTDGSDGQTGITNYTGLASFSGAASPENNRLVLIMDPPRAGSTERFLSAAARLAPERIVYISCNPATQARDVAHLVAHGYRVSAVQPVDMFPHTSHVECVCALERCAPPSRVR
ncbi:23S rRNA (uracil(1939)-C(5))-methyltransferase RlmD [Adlercreutzia sp. ZJ141]|uniref:23S rRNA (uracil(1939)-C(5))-methyltransferase RlmD n=1 Tax=Adlercreutzia sp. ZJ141 TaxID=2709406 RepID=UPI001F15559E|nr:23S rRNA (uracil(1939)-C(5))-methyltransferase RlmD [Adlercreutzia sp. ZJ141]